MRSIKSLSLVLAGLAFCGVSATATAAASVASYVRSDTTTQGNWRNVYGADGYSVAGDSQNLPSYSAFSVQNQMSWTWSANPPETRDLQRGTSSGRIAATWYNTPTFNFDVNFSDGNSHQFAVYALDWDSRGRAETIQVLDATTNALLDTRTISNFSNGIYLVWNITGHVKVYVTLSSGPNSVISGVFFGGSAPATAASAAVNFVRSDVSTQGNWHGVYGGDGSSIANDSQSLPTYTSFTPQNALTYTWAANPSDARALQTGSGAGRIAATWYNTPTFSFNVNFTDGAIHTFAIYAVDWDLRGRAETIQIADAASNTVLNTQNISGFNNGIYLIWNISGNVKINITATNGPNAVVSGVFFGGASQIVTTAASNTSVQTITPVTTIPTSTTTTTTTTSASSSSSSSSSGFPSGLVLHWTFDTANASSGTEADASNNGGSGTINNTTTVPGVLNQAFSFNGINSYVTMYAFADKLTAFYNSMTLSAWINTTNATRTEAIISKYNAAGEAAGYIFRTDAAGHLELSMGAEDLNGYPSTGVDTSVINDGNWHHVVAVINIGQSVQFYVDGKLSSTAAVNTAPNGDEWSNLNVGVCQWVPFGNWFTGSIDDVQIYNRALSASEVGTVFMLAGGVPSQSSSIQNSSIQTQTATSTQTTIQTQAPTTVGQLSLSLASYNFGNVPVGSSVSQGITISNTGTASVSISNVSISGAGFNASGGTGAVLAPGQTTTLNLTFSPASTGNMNGTVTVPSNASNSSLSITLSGTGVQPVSISYSVALQWSASASSNIVGYNVYRGTVSGGPYSMITNSPIGSTNYTDGTAQTGQNYYYVVTSVDNNNNQSTYSNQTSAYVP